MHKYKVDVFDKGVQGHFSFSSGRHLYYTVPPPPGKKQMHPEPGGRRGREKSLNVQFYSENINNVRVRVVVIFIF